MENGYVTKPINGRCGNNVTIYNNSGNVVEKRLG